MKYDLIQSDIAGMFRIVSLKDFEPLPGFPVKAGDIGGYVSSKKNLCETDNSWIYDTSKVCDGSRVQENSVLMKNSIAYSNSFITENAVITNSRLNTGLCFGHTRLKNCEVYSSILIGIDASDSKIINSTLRGILVKSLTITKNPIVFWFDISATCGCAIFADDKIWIDYESFSYDEFTKENLLELGNPNIDRYIPVLLQIKESQNG